MPTINIPAIEHPIVSQNLLNLKVDFSYQNNRLNPQSTSDRTNNYSDFTFSNNVQIVEDSIKMDSTNFINLPINVSNVSQATFIYWGEHFTNDVTLNTRGILTNRSPGNNNRFNLLMTADSGGGMLPNRIYYDWATSSSEWNSGIVAPHHGPFMFAISVNSTGATLSLIDKDSGIKRTFRRSQGHSAISFTQSVLGVSVNVSGQDLFSLQYYYKLFFWTRALSDSEVTSVFNLTKDQVLSPRKVSYLIRGFISCCGSPDDKATVCAKNVKSTTATNYYSNRPYEFLGTGSYLYSDQGLTATPGSTYFALSYVSPGIYAKINRSTGEIQEWGPC